MSISLSALKPTLLLVVFGLLLGEYLLPDIERHARNTRVEARSSNADIAPFFGFWYREGDVFMHFDEVSRSGVLGGVSHYYFDDDNRMRRALFADRAVYHDVRPDEKYWLMEKVTLTDFAGDHTRSRSAREPAVEHATRARPAQHGDPRGAG
ncbi:MAG: LptF/LptG family permease [Gammaproteobacteria bacterium]|nr:LptF/LptG family permease [Gammaproteobacteria bacterium]